MDMPRLRPNMPEMKRRFICSDETEDAVTLSWNRVQAAKVYL